MNYLNQERVLCVSNGKIVSELEGNDSGVILDTILAFASRGQ
jgi:hypothetical protein